MNDEKKQKKKDRGKDKEKISERSKVYKIRRILKKIFLTLFVIVLIILIGLGIKFGPTISKLYTEAYEIVSNIKEDDFKTNANSHVFDNKGNELFSLKSDKDVEYLTYANIPTNVKNAFVSVEDKNFWTHRGVDYKALFRAGYTMIKNKGEITQGGSTITQQLVKLTYLSTEQSFDRKFKEAIISLEVEKKFSKEDILSFYINDVYFGNNVYGINAASYEYFNKPAKDLSLSETAFLCAIPNNPSLFDPYTNMTNTLKRRDLILDKMVETNSITQMECDNAKNDKIVLEKREKSNNGSYDTRKDFVIKEFTEILMESDGFKFKYDFSSDAEKESYTNSYNTAFAAAKRKMYSKGYNIYTSFDSDLQKQAQKVIDTKFLGENEKKDNIYALQGASVTLENETGMVLSMIGGRTSPVKDYLDRSYNTYRQNGSSMKPIGVYGPAFDILNYVPSTIKNDSGEEGGPRNSTGYFGDIRLERAIQISSNTVAWKTFKDVTPEKGLKYLKEMEFKNIVPEDNKLTSALGGLTIGTNPMEMAGAYATIANDGKYNRPMCILKMVDAHGKVVYEHKAKNKKVYKQSTSELLTMCMEKVLDYSTNVNYKLDNNIIAAGKTGTTNDYKDGWFVGYSPKYTTAVWIGYDVPRTVDNMYGNIRPLSIWKSIMDYTHKNDADLIFKEPTSIKQVDVNWKGELVPDGQGTKEWYPIDNLPRKNEQAFDEEKKELFMQKIDETLPDIIDSKDEEKTLDELGDKLRDELSKTDIGSSTKLEIQKILNTKILSLKYNFEHPKKVEQVAEQVGKPMQDVSDVVDGNTSINDITSNNDNKSSNVIESPISPLQSVDSNKNINVPTTPNKGNNEVIVQPNTNTNGSGQIVIKGPNGN